MPPPVRATKIRFAGDLIDDAKQRFVALDRELAKLQRLRPRTLATAQMLRELQAQRDDAYRDLVELVDLAEMPAEFMGTA